MQASNITPHMCEFSLGVSLHPVSFSHSHSLDRTQELFEEFWNCANCFVYRTLILYLLASLSYLVWWAFTCRRNSCHEKFEYQPYPMVESSCCCVCSTVERFWESHWSNQHVAEFLLFLIWLGFAGTSLSRINTQLRVLWESRLLVKLYALLAAHWMTRLGPATLAALRVDCYFAIHAIIQAPSATCWL